MFLESASVSVVWSYRRVCSKCMLLYNLTSTLSQCNNVKLVCGLASLNIVNKHISCYTELQVLTQLQCCHWKFVTCNSVVVLLLFSLCNDNGKKFFVAALLLCSIVVESLLHLTVYLRLFCICIWASFAIDDYSLRLKFLSQNKVNLPLAIFCWRYLLKR